jgi:DNA-binding MarR family transcriptional regulator
MARASTSRIEAGDAGPGGLSEGILGGLIGYRLRRAQLKVFEDFIASFAPLGLKPAQFSALVLIEANPGRSQREIAAALGIQRPNFVAMMDEFERRGLAERHRSEVDRRSHALDLTEAGRALLRQGREIVRGHEERIAGGLSASERADLLRLLSRLAGTGGD